MAIETLRKYLFEENADARHVMTVLLNGIAATAIRNDAGEYQSFLASLESIAEATAQDSAIDRLLVSAGAAVQALESYNQRTARILSRRTTELQKVIGMLTEAIVTVTGERSLKALEEIQTNLLEASRLEDLRMIKARLDTCLKEVCQESVRRREETAKTIADLESCIRHADECSTKDAGTDPVTELPARSAAETTLRTVVTEPGRKFVATMVIDRIQSINVRFGYAVGNQVLAALARHVEARLQPGDILFRWSGPALLAMLPRQCTIDRLRTDLRPVFSNPMGATIDIGGRDVLIPISAAWSVFGLVPPVETILKHVDAFVTSQAPKGYL